MIVSIDTLGSPIVPTDYIETQFSTGARAMAITLVDTSMEPEFRAGDIVVVDPDLEPLPGDFICARIRVSRKPVFRRYRLVRGADHGTEAMIELAPLNPDWPTERYDNTDALEILGVMTEHTRRGRASRS